MPSVDVVRNASKRIGGVAGAVAKSVSTASNKAASSKAVKMAKEIRRYSFGGSASCGLGLEGRKRKHVLIPIEKGEN